MRGQRLPTVSVRKDWVTGLTFYQDPHGMTPPGWLQFDDPQSRISFIGGCLNIYSSQSISDSSALFCLPTVLWLLRPIGGCLLLQPKLPHRSLASHSWTCHKWHSFLAWNLAWTLSLGMLAGLHLGSSPSSAESCLCWRHSWRISWWMHASISSLQSIFPNNLGSWYTLWYRSTMSSQEESGLASSIMVYSPSIPCSTKGSHLLQQITWLYSCLLVATAWWDIIWHKYSWWSLLDDHCLCSLR